MSDEKQIVERGEAFIAALRTRLEAVYGVEAVEDYAGPGGLQVGHVAVRVKPQRDAGGFRQRATGKLSMSIDGGYVHGRSTCRAYPEPKEGFDWDKAGERIQAAVAKRRAADESRDARYARKTASEVARDILVEEFNLQPSTLALQASEWGLIMELESLTEDETRHLLQAMRDHCPVLFERLR